MKLMQTKYDKLISEIEDALSIGKFQSSNLIFLALAQKETMIKLEQSLGITFTNISKVLAERLVVMSRKERQFEIESLVSNIISKSNEVAYIYRINLLFEQSLNVDPLKLLQHAAKKKPIIVIWPGSIDSMSLSYAKPGLPDYKSYKLNEFQDVQVITTCEQGVK